MPTDLGTHWLLQEHGTDRCSDTMSPTVHRELLRLATLPVVLPVRSRTLHLRLRELSGRPRLVEWLRGLQVLAQRSEPTGARLLAAFLDANTPGSRLTPRLHAFVNCRRVRPLMQILSWTNSFFWDWELRLRDLQVWCQERICEIDGAPFSHGDAGGDPPVHTWLSRSLRHFVTTLQQGGDLPPADQILMAELLHLETDAYQERLAQLASKIDPFRRMTVLKVLPLLLRGDAEIHDLRGLAAWIEAGGVTRAFQDCVPRCQEVMSRDELKVFGRELNRCSELAPLAAAHRSLLYNSIPIQQLAGGVARLMALAHQLRLAGVRESELDLLTAVRIVLECARGNELCLPVAGGLREAVATALDQPTPDGEFGLLGMTGFKLTGDNLLLGWPRPGTDKSFWPNDLPTLTRTHPALGLDLSKAVEEDPSPPGIAEIRQLVLDHVESESCLLGFLRNPRIVSIPGLVAAVVARSRSLRVQETIARDRSLHSGHANKAVPLALLTSPCNIPLGMLMKFIHVKHVSKIDLQNLVRRKAYVRREIAEEVNRYLELLAR